MTSRPAARRGDPSSFSREAFHHGAWAHEVYRKGAGPAVIVIPEIPGLTPMVLGFADRLVDAGLSVALPNLYGEPGRDVDAESGLRRAAHLARVLGGVCVSREFTLLAAGRESPVLPWLRALAAHEHARCGGPGVGAVGMCLTGGFALAMAIDPRVVAPVLSQPSL
ncbi:MAG: dienelactone hydrolase family protein, partial [Myxococcota bacterium]